MYKEDRHVALMAQSAVNATWRVVARPQLKNKREAPLGFLASSDGDGGSETGLLRVIKLGELS